MIVITQELLEQYVPAAKESTNSTFVRVQQFFISAEKQLYTMFTAEAVTGICDAVLLPYYCNYAFAKAIPYLDISRNPNGFTVVNTEKLAPASKERVANLLSACFEASKLALLDIGMAVYNSENPIEKCKFFNHFFWSRENLQSIFTEIPDRWNIKLYEFDIIVEKYLSLELIAHLKSQTKAKNLSDDEISLIDLLCEVYANINNKVPASDAIVLALRFINDNLESFPSFSNSYLVQSQAIHYENKQEDSAYFFS